MSCKPTWSQVGSSLLVGTFGATSVTKLAGFDMDWTVIRTKSGKKFPTYAGDWMWWHSTVPTKLRELHKEGYAIVIFTN